MASAPSNLRRLTAGNSREKRHFIAIQQGLTQAAQFLITRAHQVLLGQYLPGATTRNQLPAHVFQAGEGRVPRQPLAIQT
jgi:hypothetical protein